MVLVISEITQQLESTTRPKKASKAIATGKSFSKRCRRGQRKTTQAVPNPHQLDSNTVINLSEKTLTDPCMSALSKGLSFAPTAQTNNFDTVINFQFFCNLRLREFFQGDRDCASTPSDEHALYPASSLSAPAPIVPTRNQFGKRSTFIPPKYHNASLDTYCRLVGNDVNCLLKKKKRVQSV